ncbi:MAG: glutamate/cysteine ligase family protein [Acidimicrobiia bacterium]|nr:glutamate/cysteine ligase family protein [Acidimicrobiia bacterium]
MQEPPLLLEEARDHVRRRAMPGNEQILVGLEAEWHVFDVADPNRVVALRDVQRPVEALGALPGTSRVTYEPGGQLELSTEPFAGLGDALDALERDHSEVAAALAPSGLGLVGCGADPFRLPHRQLQAPRYDAMERYFNAHGNAGLRMMTRTASLQVNLGIGHPDALQERWQVAHDIAPAMVAAFACSPIREGADTGEMSSRLANWYLIDPSRTAQPEVAAGAEGWVDYALSARVMLVRRGDGCDPLEEPLSFSQWVTDGWLGLYPTADDLDYHLTTLFPPVRLRGWLEVRYLDAVAPRWIPAVAGAVTVLIDDDQARGEAIEATRSVSELWCEAHRYGLAHPALDRAASDCLAIAYRALLRRGEHRAADRLAEYQSDYLGRRTSLAHELRRAWEADDAARHLWQSNEVDGWR